MSALAAEQAGFQALYLSGASIAYTRLGRSDVGLTTYSEVEDTLARIAERVRRASSSTPTPVSAMPERAAHVRGWSGRRGHDPAGGPDLSQALRPGRQVRGAGRRDAASCAPPWTRANHARPDPGAYRRAGLEGLDAALERAERYLEAGADALFIEALRSGEQMRAACGRFAGRAPLLANMVEGGKTPVQRAGAGRAGIRHRHLSGRHARAWPTLAGYYGSLRQHGSTTPWRDRMLDFDGLNAMIGTPELLAAGKRYEASGARAAVAAGRAQAGAAQGRVGRLV